MERDGWTRKVRYGRDGKKKKNTGGKNRTGKEEKMEKNRREQTGNGREESATGCNDRKDKIKEGMEGHVKKGRESQVSSMINF